MAKLSAALLACLCVTALADVYLHSLRGSNNRLNEQSANRNNGDRLFDSQNNNRGGYNVGDMTATAFNAGENSDRTDTLFPGGLDAGQYSEMLYEGSQLAIEWTNQHGCGGAEKTDPYQLNCNIVLQYTCNTKELPGTDLALSVNIKNGRNTDTPDAATTVTDIKNKITQNDGNRRGRHESEYWYYECQARNRNKGLFLADQKLNGNTAKYTRQNPNGNRRGLECAEERDYYPYWAPSPWVDIAYLTNQVDDCNSDKPGAYGVLQNSQNVKEIGKCTYDIGAGANDDNAKKALAIIDGPTNCTAAGGVWKTYSHKVAAPACERVGWSRANQLGNGRQGQPLTYNWTLPKVTDLGANTLVKEGVAKCVLRLRYNISTDDYDPHTINAELNDNKEKGIVSPVTNNPTVPVGSSLDALKLAINTNQFGRTFQDRSHAFYIKQRPAELAGANIYNVMVRGKRGNIVQTFPAVEYDFVPNNLHLGVGDYVHVQWTGSNTHNNGNPAGDGQAGDAGEGTGGTDRHNMVSILSAELNYPIPLNVNDEKLQAATLTKGFDCWGYGSQNLNNKAVTAVNWLDCALTLATDGYFRTKALAEAATNANALNPLLNNAPATFSGMLLKAKSVGEYHYMSTRNNNFSNRSQKGVFKVWPSGQRPSVTSRDL